MNKIIYLPVILLAALMIFYTNMAAVEESENLKIGYGYIDELVPELNNNVETPEISGILKRIINYSKTKRQGVTVLLRPNKVYKVNSLLSFENINGIRILGTGSGDSRSRLLLKPKNGAHFQFKKFAGIQFENLIIEVENVNEDYNHFIFDVRLGTYFSIDNVQFKNIYSGIKTEKVNSFTLLNSSIYEPKGKVGFFHDANPNLPVHDTKSDIVSVINFQGYKSDQSSQRFVWFDANYYLHTFELKNVELNGGDIGIRSSPTSSTSDPSALFALIATNLKLTHQKQNGLRMGSLKNAMLSDVSITNSGQEGVWLGGYLGALQFHDLTVQDSGNEGIKILANRAEGLYFYNANIINNSKNRIDEYSGVYLKGLIEGLSFTNGRLYHVGDTQKQSIESNGLTLRFFNLVGTALHPQQITDPQFTSSTHFNNYKPGQNNFWRPSFKLPDGESQIQSIKEVVESNINPQVQKYLNATTTDEQNGSQLQNTIDEFCQTGGQITLIGRHVIERKIIISENCRPIKILGTGITYPFLGSNSSNQFSQIYFKSSEAGIKLSGRGHTIANLSMVSENSIAHSLIEIDKSENILISAVWLSNAKSLLTVGEVSRLVVEKSRFSKSKNQSISLKLIANQLGKDVYFQDVIIGNESGSVANGVQVLGRYQNLHFNAFRIIRGGVGLLLKDVESVYSWAMQSDNTVYEGININNVYKSLLVDSWVGQVDSSSGVIYNSEAGGANHFKNMFIRGSRAYGLFIKGNNLFASNTLSLNNNICMQSTPTEIPCSRNFSSVKVATGSSNIKLYGGSFGLAAAVYSDSRYDLISNNAYKGASNPNRSTYGLELDSHLDKIGIYGVDLTLN